MNCRFCEQEFVPRDAYQYTCASSACVRARRSAYDRMRVNTPHRIALSRARSSAWARAHRGCERREPWLLGEPPHGTHLAGGGTELFVSPPPKWAIEHRNVRGLHGALTMILAQASGQAGHDSGEDGRQRWPSFSVVPWPHGTVGWGVYWREPRGCEMARKTFEAVLFDRPTRFRFGPLVRSKAPSIAKRGHRIVRVDAITPVSIACSSRRMWRTTPDAMALKSGLAHSFGRRVGLLADVPIEDLCLELVDHDTQPAAVDCGGKYGTVHGFVGRLTVDCNAVVHWLLEAAARGPGLGGRTAFGFGRVRVCEVAS